MYNGPQTTNWYVRPGVFKAFSAAGAGAGAFIFHFWHHDNDTVYTYGFAGLGVVKTSLKYLGLANKVGGAEVGDWLELGPERAFAPEELDRALGRVYKVGLNAMGLGYVTYRIVAHRGATDTLFTSAKVDVKNTGFFQFPAVALVGQWELLDAGRQTETMTPNWERFLDPN